MLGQTAAHLTNAVMPPRLIAVALAAVITLAGCLYTPVFSAPPIAVSINWSFAFAAVIALAYGRKAAVMVAVLGVIPVPFVLWPNNGWANLAGAGQYLLWLWGLGWCAEWQARSPRRLNYPLVAQLAMLPIHALVFLLIFPALLALNPSPWEPAAVTAIPLPVLSGLIIKDAANLYVCLLMALCLLKLPSLRRRLGLPVPDIMRLNGRVITATLSGAALLSLVFLALESFLIDRSFPAGWLEIESAHDLLFLITIGGAAMATGLAVCHSLERQLETELSLRDTLSRLRRTTADMERFTTVAAHDLQEPVRTVVSFVQLLERHLAGGLDSQGREYMSFVIGGAKRMKGMVEALLDYASLTRAPFRPEPVGIDCLLKDVLTTLRPQIAEHQIACATDRLPTVRGDRALLRQLFHQIIGNAGKFHSPGNEARIGLEVRRDNAGLWEFSVTDNGIGIQAEYRSSIFEAFRQLPQPDGTAAGVGIGLALARHIVQEHGGTIWVASGDPGHTTIRFTLPAWCDHESNAALRSAPPPLGRAAVPPVAGHCRGGD